MIFDTPIDFELRGFVTSRSIKAKLEREVKMAIIAANSFPSSQGAGNVKLIIKQ